MAVTGVTAGSLTPAPRKQLLQSAYIDFATASSSDG